jgi:adenylate cyclase
VVAGNIGSIKRAKYGVIGAAVNLTARIEAFTVGGQILISDATRAAVDAEVVVVDSFQASPKGVAQPITLLDVVGVDGLELPRFDAVLATPVQPLGVTVAVLAGKTHAAAAQPGRLVRVGPMDAELEMEADAGAAATPPAFADVAVELDGVAGRAYAKVLSRRPAGPGVLLRFTDLPDAVAAALAAAAGTTAPASR